MLEIINNYAGLINIALFGTIIGFLIHISRMSRTAIIDKYEARTEALQQKVALLEIQESTATKNHEAAIKLLERQLTFYQSLSDMPEDQRVIAIKAEYELKLGELESELRLKVEDEQRIREELSQIEVAANKVSSDPSSTAKAAMEILEKIVRMTLNSYLRF